MVACCDRPDVLGSAWLDAKNIGPPSALQSLAWVTPESLPTDDRTSRAPPLAPSAITASSAPIRATEHANRVDSLPVASAGDPLGPRCTGNESALNPLESGSREENQHGVEPSVDTADDQGE